MPETVALNRVLQCLVEAQRLDAALDVLTLAEGDADGLCRASAGSQCLDIVSYNTVLTGFAKSGDPDRCFVLLSRLVAHGLQPDDVTYGILLDTCIAGNDLGRASEVISNLSASGCKMNTVLYTTFIKGFVRSGNLERAMEIYEGMRAAAATSAQPTQRPDLITYSVLVKAHCDASNLDAGLKLLNDMVVDGVAPDCIVFNHLIEGCCHTLEGELGQQLF